MASVYQVQLKAILKSQSLEKELISKRAEIKKKGLDVIDIKTKFKDGELVKFTTKIKDASGKITTEVRDIGRAYDDTGKLAGAALQTTTNATEKTAKATEDATKKTKSFGSSMVSSAVSAAKYALSVGLIYKAFQELGKGVQYVKDLDKVMTDAQIVTGYTEDKINGLAVGYNKLARELKVTTLQVADASLEFLRQGKTAAETADLVRSSMVMATLGNLDAAQSTEYLTSITNAYKLSAEEIPSVIDKIIQLDNTFATSTEEVASALQRSALSASQAGVGLEELSSMIATISQVTRREGQVVGTALRTMFTRFQDVLKGGIDEDGMGINNVDLALKRVGITLRDTEGNFRDFTDVLEELYPIWQNLNNVEQANIAKALAGTRQRESLLVLLENETLYRKGLTEQMGAEGLAMERYESYLDSLEAAQANSTAAWEAMMQATVDGGLVKWFYDASAGLFDFIEGLGGIDALIPPIVAGFIAWAVASGALAGGLEAVALALGTVGAASLLNPVVLAVTAVAGLTLAVTSLNSEMNKTRDEAVNKWSESMDIIVGKTNSSTVAVSYFINEVDRLNNLSLFEQFKTKKGDVIEEEFEKTIEILGKTSESWEEYSRLMEKAANAAGYSVDEHGNLYKVVGAGYDVIKEYNTEIPVLTEEMYTARDATDGWSGRLDHLTSQMNKSGNEVEALESIVTGLTETFQYFIQETDKLSGNDSGVTGITEDFTELNKMFQEGTISADTYFAQMNSQLDSLDMTEVFAGNQEAASTFFTGLLLNSADSISSINELWDSGEINLTQYTESLMGVGDMFVRIGEMAEFMGVDSVVTDAIAEITGGVEQLSQAQEANIIIQDAMHKVTTETLAFGTTAFNDQMEMVSQAMAASGIAFKDTEENALTSANQIFAYLTKTDGNFQLLTEQSGKATGNMIQTVVNGAGKMISSLADMIKNFNATIYFTPSIDGGGGSIIDMLLGKSPLPTVSFDVGANVTSSGTPDMGLSAITGGGYESTFGSGGGGSIFDTLSGFGESLSNWEVGDVDYGKPAGQLEELEGTVGSLANAFAELGKASGKSKTQLEEDAKSIDALLAMVVKKIKQEAKARKDSLKEQLSDYKKIINTRKDLLKTYQDEEDYQRSLSSKQRDLSNIQSELEEIRLDDSEEAAARRRALQEEEAEMQLEISEEQSDRSIELQENALDAEYNNFKEYIDGQIGSIDDYLSRDGAIVGDALAIIGAKGETLYSDLSNWNAEYGSGIQNDVTTAWNDAYEAMSHYAGGLGAITGNAPSTGDGLSELDGGNGYGSISSILPPVSDMYEGRQLPSMGNTGSGENMGTGMNIGTLMELNVAGNLDKSVLPEIERIANRVVEKLNENMQMRGLTRNASQFSG